MSFSINENEIINQIEIYNENIKFLKENNVLEKDFSELSHLKSSLKGKNYTFIIQIIQKNIKSQKTKKDNYLLLLCNIFSNTISETNFRPIKIFSKYYPDFLSQNIYLKNIYIISDLKCELFDNKTKKKKEIVFVFTKKTNGKQNINQKKY